jgi:two-component system sensor histidine kinase AlgZ
LQPLVENAVKHGIAGSAEGGVIRISAEAAPGGVRLCVESPLSSRRPHRSSGSGFGQKLVQGRLAALYAGRASAEFQAREGSWISTLFLPDEEPEA